CYVVLFFFFFKQKTAYEIFTRLEFRRVLFRSVAAGAAGDADAGAVRDGRFGDGRELQVVVAGLRQRLRQRVRLQRLEQHAGRREIGRASCRERVEISVVGGLLRKKEEKRRSDR